MGQHILVCDDDAFITRAVRMKLEKAGYEVRTASDGQAGWEHATASTPLMVVTDYQMPRCDGLELCRRLRAHEPTAGLPVVLLTAKGFELDHERLMEETGVSRVLAKPFSPKELLDLVQELLGATVGTQAAE